MRKSYFFTENFLLSSMVIRSFYSILPHCTNLLNQKALCSEIESEVDSASLRTGTFVDSVSFVMMH